MSPGEPVPFGVSPLSKDCRVGEVMIRQEITPQLQAALDRGCRTQVGTEMLFGVIPAHLKLFGVGTTSPDELRAMARVSYRPRREPGCGRRIQACTSTGAHDMKPMLAAGRRGRKNGGEMPLDGAPRVARIQGRLLAEVAGIPVQKPDLVEWRADHLIAVADTGALRTACGTLPLVFICRSSNERRRPIALDDEQIVDLYAAMVTSRFVGCVDFELEHDASLLQHGREAAHGDQIRFILSSHSFGCTPGIDFVVDRFLEVERQSADLAMVSVMPRDRTDVLTLLAATARAHDKAHIRLIDMSVGPLDAVTRMVGGPFGSCLSHAVGETASAPGQVPIGDLVTVLDVLRRSRGGEMH